MKRNEKPFRNIKRKPMKMTVGNMKVNLIEPSLNIEQKKNSIKIISYFSTS